MSDAGTQRPGSWLRVAWAVLLSLLQPGLGHVYSGAWKLGVGLWAIGTVVGIVMMAITRWLSPTAIAIFAMLFLAVYAPITIDAGRRVRRRYDKTRVPWYRSTWIAAIVLVCISAGISFVPGNTVGWRSFSIASGSMLPSLHLNDRILVGLYRPGQEPMRGDVIVYVNPQPPHVDFVKRVVGLPGDVVQMRQGVLYLNAKPVPRQPTGTMARLGGRNPPLMTYRETMPDGRAYAIAEISDTAPGDNTAPFTVPADRYFVLGDNRDDSLDSRHQGFVPKANLIGIAHTVYWSREFDRILSRVE